MAQPAGTPGHAGGKFPAAHAPFVGGKRKQKRRKKRS
jgi:hypothetical protein